MIFVLSHFQHKLLTYNTLPTALKMGFFLEHFAEQNFRTNVSVNITLKIRKEEAGGEQNTEQSLI